MYRTIANVVFVLQLIFHIFFIRVLMALIPPEASVLWAIPFAFAYAVFIGITVGITYYYILPKKSKKYWED